MSRRPCSRTSGKPQPMSAFRSKPSRVDGPTWQHRCPPPTWWSAITSSTTSATSPHSCASLRTMPDGGWWSSFRAPIQLRRSTRCGNASGVSNDLAARPHRTSPRSFANWVSNRPPNTFSAHPARPGSTRPSMWRLSAAVCVFPRGATPTWRRPSRHSTRWTTTGVTVWWDGTAP